MSDHSTKRYRRYSGSFWRGLLGVLSGAGNCPTSLDPPRYPKDAQHQDLKRIGQGIPAIASRVEDGKDEDMLLRLCIWLCLVRW